MAPITDDTVQALRDTVHKLESRVQQLEARLGEGSSGAGKSSGSLDSVRMILMGPPGAGICSIVQNAEAEDTDMGEKARELKHPRFEISTVPVT